METSTSTANARVTAWSGVFFNLGTALAAAIGYRVFVEQKVDPTAGLWIFGALSLMAVGHGFLALIEEIGHDDL